MPVRARRCRVNVLAIDTSTDQAHIGLYEGTAERTIFSLSWRSPRQQTRELAARIAQACAESRTPAAALDLLAVATGPGSFTGVRIGLSVAKGMALGAARPLPLVGVPNLSCVLSPLHRQAQATCPGATLIGVAPVGREKFAWTALAAQEAWRYCRQEDLRWGSAQDLEACLRARAQRGGTETVWLGGTVPPSIREQATAWPELTLCAARDERPTAIQLARLALRRWRRDPDGTAPQSLAPLYLGVL